MTARRGSEITPDVHRLVPSERDARREASRLP